MACWFRFWKNPGILSTFFSLQTNGYARRKLRGFSLNRDVVKTANPQRLLGQARPLHPYQWLWEPVEQESSFVIRAMFGAKALYLHGLMMVCFCVGKEPWRGLLLCTDKTHHASLIAEFSSLRPHPVLGKWLYLPESANDFESTAKRLIRLAQSRDLRLGVVPGVRKRKAKKPQRPSRPKSGRRTPKKPGRSR